ncbi:phosphate import ATP-binding protein PstB [Pullulanibacillus camelliae]|uniref:Phosphate import ATP-binding protein PstB n=1 Tax=Pullulanibacillus camelliae TaxID=1707096 RepID=A0A8J2VLV0_9BACL|nr:phosphate ABC transporter ATP-binding protein PstB [Pullulanibacillus camelliae]GGE37216.1 phosphate import ATP-binding protein PstB [Pullulanibacillus camelliae]
MQTLVDVKEVYSTEGLSLWYDKKQALKDVNVSIFEKQVTAIIGPSGCGKSTFLKTLNRMVELEPKITIKGRISYRGNNLYDKHYPVEQLRHRVGMVFQKANPFPKSIYNNIAFGPRLRGIKNKQLLNEIVERSLKQAALWDEVRDKLNQDANRLSGGQQQRLCLARCLAVDPDVILMDEPTSALDPIATAKVEELVHQLKQQYSIIIVTHNMEQAKRVSDQTAFFLNGELIEQRKTSELFAKPFHKETADYISGRFG